MLHAFVRSLVCPLGFFSVFISIEFPDVNVDVQHVLDVTQHLFHDLLRFQHRCIRAAGHDPPFDVVGVGQAEVGEKDGVEKDASPHDICRAFGIRWAKTATALSSPTTDAGTPVLKPR